MCLVMTLLAGCESGAGRAARPPARDALQSITRDCSRPVEGEIMAYLASVANGATVTFPAQGCYALENTILVADRENITIDGNGSTFAKHSPTDKARASNANWRIAGGNGVTIRNMVVRGSYEPPPRGTPGQGLATDHGVSLWGSVRTSVRDVEVTNVDGECLTADSDIRKGTDYRFNPPSRDITVERLRCTHAGRQGVAATAVDGFTLSNSTIDNAQQNGVDIEIDAPGQLARNVRIVDNTIGHTYFSAIAVPLGDSPEVGNIEIKRNRMATAPDTCYPAIFVGDARFQLRDIVITDNTLLTIGDGIRLTKVDTAQVARNLIRKTNPENTACHNQNFQPPANVAVRLFDSTVALEGNTVVGLLSDT